MDFDYSADSSPSTSSRNNNNMTSTNNVAAGAANRKRKHEVSQGPSESSQVDGISPNSPSRPNSSASGEANSDSRSDLNGGDDCVIVNEVNGKPSKFNDDLLCEHGNLTFAVKRVWLHRWEWEMLRSNYADYFEAIPCSTLECSECVDNYFSARTEQATCLSLLEAIQNEILKTMRVLCPKFVQKICKPSRTKTNIEIPRICQECLLCEHNAPYMVLDEQESEKCSAGFPITYEEWNDLLRVYAKHSPSYPRPVEIKLAPNGNYDFFCAICNMQHLEEEDNKRYCYPEGGDIYIKLQGDGGEEQETKTQLASVTTRRLAAKNLLKFKMTSCSKVIDLKLKVYEQIKQSPADQLIYLSQIALEDSQTLESARVEANNVDNPLILIVQQRMETSTGEPRQLEKGFRDTALSI
uniref:Ubiquitin-like domain-containing protein n=1 Tax=Ditylenchus dipsaci TaxID=166011 RepID=A0A915EJQ2_9BILA